MLYRIVLTATLLAACSRPLAPISLPAPEAPNELAYAEARERIGTRTACLTITDAYGKPFLRTDESRCAQRLRPFSTFKIPNSLIGLEAGILEDATSVASWSSETYPPQDWWPAIWTSQAHTLASAFRYSLVPYYQSLATQIGRERMSAFVTAFRYGNKNISGNLDSFWLDGGIAISADEQVVTLSAKTGTGERDDGTTLAWLVGYVEFESGGVHYFAFNIESDSADAVSPEWRISTVQAVMAELGIWPKN